MMADGTPRVASVAFAGATWMSSSNCCVERCLKMNRFSLAQNRPVETRAMLKRRRASIRVHDVNVDWSHRQRVRRGSSLHLAEHVSQLVFALRVVPRSVHEVARGSNADRSL